MLRQRIENKIKPLYTFTFYQTLDPIADLGIRPFPQGTINSRRKRKSTS